MADKRIDDLTQALAINDDDLFVLQQSSEAKKLKGSQLKQYAKDAVNVEVQQAATYAKNAADSATDSATGATAAAHHAENAAAAKNTAVVAATNAEAAKNAIANMIVEAVTLETGQPANVTKTLVDQVYKLTFGLPRGEQGIQGEQGETGTGIQSIALTKGNHAPGTSDTYTITLTDGNTYNFLVYNGANGTGAGDMLASVYDPQNKHQDIFAYVDNAIKDVKVTTDATPTQGSTNPVQSGGVYSALNNKLDKTGDGSNVTAAFTAASTRINIATGEKLSVLLGKIAKWLGDLKALAFKDEVAKTDLAKDVQQSLSKADSALQSAPVTSVNNKIGEVTVTEVPSGGSEGQVLMQTPEGPSWQDLGSSNSVFVAVYGTTTFDEIYEAMNAGALVVLRNYPNWGYATLVQSIIETNTSNQPYKAYFYTNPLNGQTSTGMLRSLVATCAKQDDGTTKWGTAQYYTATLGTIKQAIQILEYTGTGDSTKTFYPGYNIYAVIGRANAGTATVEVATRTTASSHISIDGISVTVSGTNTSGMNRNGLAYSLIVFGNP